MAVGAPMSISDRIPKKTYMKRYLQTALAPYLNKKIVLVSGPRQVGKTTLAKAMTKDYAYYNYDIRKDLHVFLKQEWDRDKELVIFDELHKMKKWVTRWQGDFFHFA